MSDTDEKKSQTSFIIVILLLVAAIIFVLSLNPVAFIFPAFGFILTWLNQAKPTQSQLQRQETTLLQIHVIKVLTGIDFTREVEEMYGWKMEEIAKQQGLDIVEIRRQALLTAAEMQKNGVVNVEKMRKEAFEALERMRKRAPHKYSQNK